MIQLPNGQTDSPLSIIKDPFKVNFIQKVEIEFSNYGYTKPYWKALVRFKNGNTSGQQDTEQVESFDEVVIKTKQIIDSITNKP